MFLERNEICWEEFLLFLRLKRADCWRIRVTLEGSNFPWIKPQGLQPAFQNRPSPWPEWGRHQVRGAGRWSGWYLAERAMNGNLLADSELQVIQRKTSVIFCKNIIARPDINLCIIESLYIFPLIDLLVRGCASK